MKTLFESLIDDDEPPPDLQTIRRWIGDAKKESAAAERARIRRDLLEAIAMMEYRPFKTSKPHIVSLGMRRALDRICPEEPA